MRLLKKRLAAGLAIAAGLVATSQPAMAWGDREQGILTGIAGAVLWNKLNERHPAPPVVHPVVPARIIHHHPPRVISYQEPVTVYPSLRNCREIPVKDASGQIIEIRRLCEQ